MFCIGLMLTFLSRVLKVETLTEGRLQRSNRSIKQKNALHGHVARCRSQTYQPNYLYSTSGNHMPMAGKM
jgi:hypothetical protein